MFYVYNSLTFAIDNGKIKTSSENSKSNRNHTQAHTQQWHCGIVWFFSSIFFLSKIFFRDAMSVKVFGAYFCWKLYIVFCNLYVCDMSDFFFYLFFLFVHHLKRYNNDTYFTIPTEIAHKCTINRNIATNNFQQQNHFYRTYQHQNQNQYQHQPFHCQCHYTEVVSATHTLTHFHSLINTEKKMAYMQPLGGCWWWNFSGFNGFNATINARICIACI